MSVSQAVAIALVALPALAFVLWPLAIRRRGGDVARGSAADDRALEMAEEKAAVYRALRELHFDHEAGHLSDDDYEGLRARYEGRAAKLIAALDALAPSPPPPTVAAAATADERPVPRRSALRHPATLAAGAIVLVVFGVVIGLNAGRFTEPDRSVIPPGLPDPGSPPVALMPPVAGVEPGKPISPEMLAGMLRAARESLAAGRYTEAIAAYQAVLKRDPRNVDAMTHLGLIVAIGGHADAALEAFDKALAIDPTYAPAYLYRGEVLSEVKRDHAGAVKAWERFLALVPSGPDHDRVAALVKDAQAKTPSAAR